MEHSTFLKKLYCDSLTPFERLALSKKVKINFEKDESQLALRNWKKSLSKEGSEKAFNEYCRAQNIDSADLPLMTANHISIQSEVQLPEWVKTLSHVLVNIDDNHCEPSEQNRGKPFFQLLAPFINYFVQDLKEKLLDQCPSQNLIDQMCTALHKDLINISHTILFNEFSKYLNTHSGKTSSSEDFHFKNFTKSILVNCYYDLFKQYPMLGRKLAIKTVNYTNFIHKMLGRFEHDKHEIMFKLDLEVKNLTRLYLNSGDQHNGESTVILEFENGNKIVYKPGDLGISEAYHEFIRWVNSKLGCELKTFEVINKTEYGWLEFVDNLSCKTNEEIQGYYEKAGILSGIAYFLNARDYHYENLIASGNSPVLIDHETIVNPIIQKKHRKPNDFNVGTILETLLLPIPNDIDPPYISGFGSSVQTHSKNYIPKIKNCNKDSMTTIPELVTNELFKSNKPRINGEIANLKDYQEEYKRGFDQLYTLILSNKDELLSSKSPLNNFKNLKVRLIYRSTGVYLKILRSLNSPQCLSNPVSYGIKVELLARAYSISNNWSPILNCEREQILNGDVPAFYVDTLAKSLILESGEIGEGFACSALDVIKHKIKNAENNDYTNQMKLIEKVIEL